MAQVAMTVRLDSDVKMKFDSLCQEFGMSANTAFNVFVNAVIRNKRIPFAIEAGQNETSQQRALNAIESMRAKTQTAGVDDLSLEDINKEIRLARAERKGWLWGMVYAVVDTNVLVSALWAKNPLASTRRVLDMLVARKFTPLYNAEVIAEYRDVLNRPKFLFEAQEVEDLIGYIMEIGENTARTKYDELMPDDDDRVFYEISLTVEDSFLVTGNLKHYPKVPKVVTPSEFLERIIQTL